MTRVCVCECVLRQHQLLSPRQRHTVMWGIWGRVFPHQQARACWVTTEQAVSKTHTNTRNLWSDVQSPHIFIWAHEENSVPCTSFLFIYIYIYILKNIEKCPKKSERTKGLELHHVRWGRGDWSGLVAQLLPPTLQTEGSEGRSHEPGHRGPSLGAVCPFNPSLPPGSLSSSDGCDQPAHCETRGLTVLDKQQWEGGREGERRWERGGRNRKEDCDVSILIYTH